MDAKQNKITRPFPTFLFACFLSPFPRAMLNPAAAPSPTSNATNSGEGLLFYGSTIIPFKDKFDKTLKLYSLMTTKPEEVEARKQKEMEE